MQPTATGHLVEFRLELGLPVWTYQIDGLTIEKRVIMPHGQNTTHVTYRLLAGRGRVRLSLRPSIHFRPYDAPVDESPSLAYTVTATRAPLRMSAGPDSPGLRLRLHGRKRGADAR